MVIERSIDVIYCTLKLQLLGLPLSARTPQQKRNGLKRLIAHVVGNQNGTETQRKWNGNGNYRCMERKRKRNGNFIVSSTVHVGTYVRMYRGIYNF